MSSTLTKAAILDMLRQHEPDLMRLGVKSIALFGSYAKDAQTVPSLRCIRVLPLVPPPFAPVGFHPGRDGRFAADEAGVRGSMSGLACAARFAGAGLTGFVARAGPTRRAADTGAASD
jgi:hypothetical protein